jgi:hypothetical protein
VWKLCCVLLPWYDVLSALLLAWLDIAHSQSQCTRTQQAKQTAPLQMDLAQGMDRMLRAETLTLPSDKARLRPRERLNHSTTQGIAPYLKLMDEEEAAGDASTTGNSFTPEDAAVLLGREPYARVVKRLDVHAQRAFVPADQSPVPVPSKTLAAADPAAKPSKYDFMFVNVPASKTMATPVGGIVDGAPGAGKLIRSTSTLVRDREGNLRQATNVELWRKRNAKPRFFM